ncbi:hypothetical protein BDR07DRAFT_1371245 [Suillus spraguei]|nr:hypothetical protein BDR07DRAFT_1371245 [Suillus spraguei]
MKSTVLVLISLCLLPLVGDSGVGKHCLVLVSPPPSLLLRFADDMHTERYIALFGVSLASSSVLQTTPLFGVSLASSSHYYVLVVQQSCLLLRFAEDTYTESYIILLCVCLASSLPPPPSQTTHTLRSRLLLTSSSISDDTYTESYIILLCVSLASSSISQMTRTLRVMALFGVSLPSSLIAISHIQACLQYHTGELLGLMSKLKFVLAEAVAVEGAEVDAEGDEDESAKVDIEGWTEEGEGKGAEVDTEGWTEEGEGAEGEGAEVPAFVYLLAMRNGRFLNWSDTFFPLV